MTFKEATIAAIDAAADIDEILTILHTYIAACVKHGYYGHELYRYNLLEDAIQSASLSCTTKFRTKPRLAAEDYLEACRRIAKTQAWKLVRAERKNHVRHPPADPRADDSGKLGKTRGADELVAFESYLRYTCETAQGTHAVLAYMFVKLLRIMPRELVESHETYSLYELYRMLVSSLASDPSLEPYFLRMTQPLHDSLAKAAIRKTLNGPSTSVAHAPILAVKSIADAVCGTSTFQVYHLSRVVRLRGARDEDGDILSRLATGVLAVSERASAAPSIVWRYGEIPVGALVKELESVLGEDTFDDVRTDLHRLCERTILTQMRRRESAAELAQWAQTVHDAVRGRGQQGEQGL